MVFIGLGRMTLFNVVGYFDSIFEGNVVGDYRGFGLKLFEEMSAIDFYPFRTLFYKSK